MNRNVKVLLSVILIFTFMLAFVSASASTISSVNVTENEDSIIVSGVAASDCTAVAISVFKENGEDLVTLKTAKVLDDNTYTLKINLEEGKYVVKVADYAGGAYITKENVVVKQKEDNTNVIEEINVTLNAPIIGEKVTSKLVENENMGGYEQDNRPVAIAEKDAGYVITDTMWIKGTYKEVGDDFEEPITATFEKDKYYYATIYIAAKEGYKLDEDLDVKVNGEKPAEVFAVYANGSNTFFIAKIKAEEKKEEPKGDEDQKEQETYVFSSDSFVIEFTDEKGEVFEFNIQDVSNLTDEQLAKMKISREEYTKIVNKIKANLSDYKEVIAVYEIEVFDKKDSINKTTGTFKFKIKMTEEMKKYNSFKLVNINKDDFSTKDVVELKVEGEYLVGELPHLSIYALVADSVDTSVKTGDTIVMYIAILSIALIGMVALFVIKKSVRAK